MNATVEQARKEDVPAFFVRLSNMDGRKNGSLVTIKNGDRNVKVQAYPMPAEEECDTSDDSDSDSEETTTTVVYLPKALRLALGVSVRETVSVE